jgi:hypothetical protein
LLKFYSCRLIKSPAGLSPSALVLQMGQNATDAWMLDDLGVTPICEGVETAEELAILLELGVDLIQGYFVGRPVFEGLGEYASLQLQTRFASVR